VHSSKSRFQKGDILYGKLRPYLDKAVIAGTDGICSTDILVFRAKPDVCISYLLGLIHSQDFLEHAAQTTNGVNHPRTSWPGLSPFTWNVHEDVEQRKIAAVLWKIQRAIEVEDKLTATARELKMAAMRQLFTHGLRDIGQQETEIGRIPASWKPTAISAFGDVVTGTTPKTSERCFYEGDTAFDFIAPGDLGDTTRIYGTAKKLTEAGLRASRVLPKNSVCFVCIGSTIGKVGITTKEESTTNQQINSILVGPQFDPFYVCYLLFYFSRYVSSFASPSPVPIMSKGKFEQIEIYSSQDKTEQEEIAQILSRIDDAIEHHQRKLLVLHELFGSLLHKLMTGEIRVASLEIDVSEVTQ
jgi:type I restriction enzyme S subunit